MTLSFATLLIGLVAIFVWIRVFQDIPNRSAILVKALPVCFAASLAGYLIELLAWSAIWTDIAVRSFIGLVLIAPLVEETAKCLSIRNMADARGRLAFVSLFGVLELAISKPLTMTNATHWIEFFQILPAVTMHVLTGVVFVYRLAGRLIGQLVVCCIIHATYNGAVLLASHYDSFDGILFVLLVGMVVAIILLLPRRRPITG